MKIEEQKNKYLHVRLIHMAWQTNLKQKKQQLSNMGRKREHYTYCILFNLILVRLENEQTRNSLKQPQQTNL